MAYSDDTRILIKIARMYYEEGATQAEIAEVLGVSRPLISKYLTKAKESRLVEIRIHDEMAHTYSSLESTLEKKFNLREAIVIDEINSPAGKHNLGAAAGNYLLRVVKKNHTIGVSSGTTLVEVATAMPGGNLPNVIVVPLVGGMGDERLDIHANQLAVQIAERLQADYKLLHAPVVVDSPEAKTLFLEQSSIAEVFNLASHCDIAIVGIGGAPEHSTMVKNYFGPNFQKEFTESDVIGDICYNFINQKGEASSISWNERVLSLPLETLKAIPLVIGVAHGEEKVQSIRAALTGGLVNVLVTDEPTAQQLIQD
ncbi:sugar-binding transcriptional regulator [Fodinisporobacter ferrooxydans]|uniref:Sugar-binding transcriptional regulator n=1 Tax=Fodinisporobacter ferrooxydans TaxID=2901836 RepID=A0ABY4CK76_9BACL|nr:sugar-binding transcriptional regulator [Alicyclobacillaceae bacterium MYW30-H2]